MASTKAELIETLDERTKEIETLREKLQAAEAETRRFQNDAIRDRKNRNDCEEKLSAIRQVLTAELRVRHDVDLQPQPEWFNGQGVIKEEVTPEIRLLRHIYELSRTDYPQSAGQR